MREIKYIVVHCAATKPSQDIGVAEIRDWHVKGNGWRDVGYHYIIRRDGRVEDGRPIAQAGAHVAGYNSNSIGVCLVGGVDDKGQPEANYTSAQWEALKSKLRALKQQFPQAAIQGHRDFPKVAKACPCFDVIPWAKEAGLV